MPNFKEFIKGFEEKPEAEQPKTQEVKMEQPKPQPKQQPLFDDIETPEQKYSKGYAPNMTYGQAQKAYQEGKISHSDLMRVWHQGGYAKKSLEQAEKHAEKYLKEKRMRPGSDPVTTPKEQLNVHQPKVEPKPQPKEEPLFDERLLSTKKGLEEAKNFLDAKGVKDIYTISDKQFDALADEAAKKYGISRGLAKGFLVAPYEYDPYKYEPDLQPKQGSFEQVFGGTSEVEDEKETQPDGYYKDDNGEIYMMKGGKDYYPVGEEERTDFFRAFNNQNKEKAKEMANDPETARSFERIHADLVKGFEETYKRKPSQEEKDAIRDIARLQTALVAMARKK